MPAPQMIEFSETYRVGFLEDQAEFIDFDPDFGDTFADDWNTAVEASLAVPTAEAREDDQQGMTEAVLALMKDGRKAYRLNRYFVVKAFPGNINVQNKFALDTYVADSSTQGGMALLLTELNTRSEKPEFKPQLLAAGYTQENINSLLTLRNALRGDNADQNNFIRRSPEATSERWAVHNHTWSFAQKVNAASKVLYMDNILKLNFYTFPASYENPEVFDLMGTITDSVTNLPIAGVTVKFPTLGFSTTTDANGKYGAAGLPTGNVPLEVSMLGYVLQNLTADIPASGTATLNVALVPNP